jgi:tetratricopeptide (TPR) repeat protein
MKLQRCLLGGLGVLAAAVAVANAGGPLARPSSPEARAHLDRGIKLYEVRSFAEAIVELKAGAIAESAPVFDYNLGQCYRQIGKYEDALWHYDRFLTYGHPVGELRDAVVAFIAEMKAHLANRALTMPPTEPAHAVDGEEPHKAQSRPVEAAQPHEARSGHDWIGWSFAGAGVASLGAAGLFFWSASSLHDQANTEPDMLKRTEVRNQGDRRALIGGIVGAAGVALIGVGAVHFLVSSPEPTPRGVAWGITIGPGGVALIGDF